MTIRPVRLVGGLAVRLLAYRIEVDTDTWSSQSGAMSAFTASQQQRSGASPLTSVGADSATLQASSGVAVALKGTTVVVVVFQPPGGLSGNPSVPATFPPSGVTGLTTLMQDVVAALSS